MVTHSHSQGPLKDTKAQHSLVTLIKVSPLDGLPSLALASMSTQTSTSWPSQPFWKALLYGAKLWFWKEERLNREILTLRINIPETSLSNLLFSNTAVSQTQQIQLIPKSNIGKQTDDSFI